MKSVRLQALGTDNQQSIADVRQTSATEKDKHIKDAGYSGWGGGRGNLPLRWSKTLGPQGCFTYQQGSAIPFATLGMPCAPGTSLRLIP